MPPGDLAPVFLTSLITITIAAVLIFRGPLGKALGRRLEGAAGQNPEGDGHRLVEFEARLADLEANQTRVAELEERVDFAERLLAQSQHAPKELPR